MKYVVNEKIVTITMDDGKVNAVGHQFLDDINAGLDRAEAEQAAAVIICGREGIFSGGFDLKEFKQGPEAGFAMVKRGFELLIRLYSFPLPLVAASAGHGIGMGAFIVMACDSRIAARGDFKMSLPETSIGMELPPILVALAASRISRRHMTRVALQSEAYYPEQAVDAGFTDEVVDAGELYARATQVARQLAQLPQAQYAANKRSIRAHTLQLMQNSLEELDQG